MKTLRKTHPGARWVVRLLLAGLVLGWPACSRHRPRNREVWAEVDGQRIYRDQVESYYRARIKSAPDSGSAEQELNIKLNLLNQVINNRILLDRAAAARITVTEAQVSARWNDIHAPYSDREFASKLNQQGLTPEGFRQQLRESLLIEKLLNQEVTSRVRVSEAEIRAYYDHNKASFDVPETQYHLAQILVTSTADREVQNLRHSDAITRAEAARKMRMLERELRQGADFATLAQQYSEDPHTVTGGGDMGFVPTSALTADPPMGQAVARLKAGEYSGIVRDRHGDFHILKLLGRVEAGQRPLTDPQVEATIRQNLKNEKEQLLRAAYIENLRNQAHVKDYLAEGIVAAGGDAAPVR